MATVVVFGGGGFLGRRLVDRLSAESVTVRVAVRHPEPARIELRSLGFDRGRPCRCAGPRLRRGCHRGRRRRGRRRLGLRRMLGHASAPKMACRHCGVSPRFNPPAHTRGVLGRWGHSRCQRGGARDANCHSE
jgi:NAD(P)-dependent dehydrogenase (short-subunit alcohol dehydrogenase family)